MTNGKGSIFVFLFLERSLNTHTDIFSLIGFEDGQFGSESTKVQSGDLLVQDLGQLVNSGLVFLGGNVLPQLQLSQSLVGE